MDTLKPGTRVVYSTAAGKRHGVVVYHRKRDRKPGWSAVRMGRGKADVLLMRNDSLQVMAGDPNHNGMSGYHRFRNEHGEYGSFEVFWYDGDLDHEALEPGWFWHACFPGCMPDGEPEGPFASSRAAWRDAREY